MSIRTVLDKLQTTPIPEAFLPYVYDPASISEYIQGLLKELETLNPSDFPSLKKIHAINAFSEELREQIFYLCIKAAIIDPPIVEGCDDFYSAGPDQQDFILSTIELIPPSDRTIKTLDAIAILFQDVLDNYNAVFQLIESIPDNLRAKVILKTSSPLGKEESGIEKALKIKFFLLLPECDQSKDNWLHVENFVDFFFDSLEDEEVEEELLLISLQDIYEKIDRLPPENRAEKIRKKELT